MFVPVHEEIHPVYEDDPARARELWQLPPRDILMELITYPFTYIPPSVAKILSLLYLASGLAFLILYRRKTSRKDPEPASRRELIRTYIREHPGRNKQEIAAALSLPRSSLNYHLNRLQKTQDILEIRYGKQLHFLPANIGLTDNQKILLSLLSREKDHLIFQTLLTQPSLTRNEIAAELNLSTTTVVWYIRKLKRSHLLTTQKQERKLRYSLTPEVVTAYQNLAKIRTPPFDGPST
ncbi:MAG: winged helix-turn-helix transcriptional regulator [Methanocorpusculum sp.]|nr:winged helix-turn-helix transcriptional regulator [Methanocorpusculum sp.]